MSRQCELTGKKPVSGNKISHANNKTGRLWLPNLKTKKYFIPELGRNVRLKLSTSAITTIDKRGGITAAIIAAKECDLSERLQKIRRQLTKPPKKQN